MKSCGTGLVVLLVAMMVSGCGGSDSAAQAPQSTDQPSIAGAPAGYNVDDVAFAQDTIALYRQTTELTTLVPERLGDPRLGVIAADIDAAQRPNLQTVKALLTQWNSDSDIGSDQGAASGPIAGMVDDATMARLKSSSGAQFDAMWLQSVIKHQQGAITTAEAEVEHGTNVDAVATARQLVSTHQAQIARMQRAVAGN